MVTVACLLRGLKQWYSLGSHAKGYLQKDNNTRSDTFLKYDKWQDKIPDEVLKKAHGLKLAQLRLYRWVGHVIKMSCERIP